MGKNINKDFSKIFDLKSDSKDLIPSQFQVDL